MKNFKRIVRIGYGEYIGQVYVTIEYTEGRLSMTGVEGPLSNGNCKGGCGQIEMGIDASYLQRLNVNPKLSVLKVRRLLGYWRKWHLNDMRAGCQHQRDAGWEDVRIDPEELPHSSANRDEKGILATWVPPDEHIEGLLGRKCVACGYKYGTAWLHEDVPEDVLRWLRDLPETTHCPART